jgi:hypothetical protein
MGVNMETDGARLSVKTTDFRGYIVVGRWLLVRETNLNERTDSDQTPWLRWTADGAVLAVASGISKVFFEFSYGA